MILSNIQRLKNSLRSKICFPLNKNIIKRKYTNGKSKIIDELTERGLITAVTR